VRKQKDKRLPSGVSPNTAYTFPEEYGGRNCLQPVDVVVIQEMLDEMQEEKDRLSDWGVPEDFAQRAQRALDVYSVGEVNLTNIWFVFQAVLRELGEL
jgi:hypothetical protein